ncbi:butanoate--CoA ligase AAE1-like isoform X1 [Phragmites australis]|uniref:butanoate--CoA ligase AAE1-like isoform X1 n=1 Tax=Phragmites australis TaxID=29695 RepID=UPI002D7A0023|nr:butanoate--CoA ligase AAE1-like isoform X1 [Phragmites australis]
MEGSKWCAANYVPLTPLSFLERAALVYGGRTAVVCGDKRYSWRETRERCLAGASALAHRGVGRRDVVAVIASNIPAMYELHFSVPMTGGVLCTLNTRHDAAMVSILLKHSDAKVFLVESQFLAVAHDALRLLADGKDNLPLLITISDDDNNDGSVMDYEALLRSAPRGFDIRWPTDERDPISLNYTSGTTSRPKGVIYSHRGAYLNSLATVLVNDMATMPVYLWTVPMFHCNGWCMVWGTAAQGGKSVCIGSVAPKVIFEQIARHGVTNMGGAPTVLNKIVNAPASERKPLPRRVRIWTGGAPPPPQVLAKMEELGFDVVHGYGLTETYGPATLCAWKPEWDALPLAERSRIRTLQGVPHLMLQDMVIKDPVTMETLPSDGRTVGEVMLRGNTIMSGYYKDAAATEETMRGGWLRTGDLGVRHPDGYLQVKDRSKDIIISGGENISSIEVESVLFGHPAVLDVAVVARPDDHWGETPCAFVTLKDGARVTADDITEFCRARLPHYMAPRTVVFADLPKTATGKTQKYLLRENARAMGSLSKQGRSKL